MSNFEQQSPVPRRPPPPPPTTAKDTFVAVDGVPEATVYVWFRLADKDKDGRVADQEAVDFFKHTGLSSVDLSSLYRIVRSEQDTNTGRGLSKKKFSQFLRLVALVQSGIPVTTEATVAALRSETWMLYNNHQPLPPPKLQLPASLTSPPQSIPLTPSEDMPVSPFRDAVDFVEPGAEISRDVCEMEKLRINSSDRTLLRSRLISAKSHTVDVPVSFDVRFPPLIPKDAARLTMLAGGGNALFAGPGHGNTVLQWLEAEGAMKTPRDNSEYRTQTTRRLQRLSSNAMHTATPHQDNREDPDCAPCFEVQTTLRKPVACMLYDHYRNLLWLADLEGHVVAFDLSDDNEPISSLYTKDPTDSKMVHRWLAFRIGHATSMCLGCNGDLWTGNSRGIVRLWTPEEQEELGKPPPCRELRKGTPNADRPHQGPVAYMASSADGQCMWTASKKGIILWDSATGMCLGVVHKGRDRNPATYLDLEGGGVEGGNVNHGKVSASRGLEVDGATGILVNRVGARERRKLRSEQEGWAAATDRGVAELMERMAFGGGKVVAGAVKAGKFLMKKVAGNNSSRGPDSGRLQQSENLTRVNSGSTHGDSTTEDEVSFTFGNTAQVYVATESTGSIQGVASCKIDNSIWVAYKKGRLEKYSATGKLLWTGHMEGQLQCVASIYSSRIWIGLSNGSVVIIDSASTRRLKEFYAHQNYAIHCMVEVGKRVYTLGADGSISGWCSSIPGPGDLPALIAWSQLAPSMVEREAVKVLCVTWNVGESKPAPDAVIFKQLARYAGVRSSRRGDDSSSDSPVVEGSGLVLMCLQEVEMGSTSVALAAYKDALSTKLQEQGNVNARFWSERCLDALGGGSHWYQVGLRQLSGMLLMVYGRLHLKSYIGEVATASVACGVLGVGGNKGAVAVEFTLHRRKVAVVCSHFAAHQNAVEQRNANYATIVSRLSFRKRNAGVPEEIAASTHLASQQVSLTAPQTGCTSSTDSDVEVPMMTGGSESGDGGGSSSSDEEDGENGGVVYKEGIRNVELLVWAGDFNYRIDGPYELVREAAQASDLGPLIAADQLMNEYKEGRVFKGLKEGLITFRPTYKFDKGDPNPVAYDSSEKRRVPAWCDRIFFRGTPPFPLPLVEDPHASSPAPDELRVEALQYGCWPYVNESDHKPVFAILEADLPVTDQHRKRRACSELLERCAAAAAAVNEDEDGIGKDKDDDGIGISVSSTEVKLHPVHLPSQGIVLQNKGRFPTPYTVVALKPDSNDITASAVTVDVYPYSGVIPARGQLTLHFIASLDQSAFLPAGNALRRYRIETENTVFQITTVVLQEFAYRDNFN